jgi:hypothetical protein
MFLSLFLYFSKSDCLCRVACGGLYQPSDFVSDRCDTYFGHIYGSLGQVVALNAPVSIIVLRLAFAGFLTTYRSAAIR